jgi:hypothetical protein
MSDAAPPSEPAELTPRRWQFDLRMLLLAMTAISVACAVCGLLGAGGSLLLMWVALLVAGHVTANAMGDRIRSGSRPVFHGEEPMFLPNPTPPRRQAPPATQLSQRSAIGWRPFVISGCGALMGAAVGLALFGYAYAPRGLWGAIAFGAVFAAALGAFLGFLASSLWQVSAGAFQEASRQDVRRK